MFAIASGRDVGLNEQQRAAATYEGPSLLVVAGAGTGKTRTLVARVGSFLERGASPERVLLLTFTRRAAREMLARARRRDEASGADRVWGGTFHATANRLLRAHGRAVGVPERFTVIDQSDAAEAMSLIRVELGLDASRKRTPRKETLAAIYSRTVNTGLPLHEIVAKHFPWCEKEVDGVRAIFKHYGERKRVHAVLDYDDLLLYWKALASHPAAGRRVSSLFDHILVDEYQDTNPVQADILAAMRSPTSTITAVGDDAQAIYSFRASTVTNILEFAERHPDTHVVKLEQNYRSTQPILDAGNAVIAGSRRRHPKELWSAERVGARPCLITCTDESEQSERVCADVLERREAGMPLSRQAVLFRAGHHSATLELELARRNIPFAKYGGLRFSEAAHIKDVVGLLRVLENPRDELAWFRSLQLLEGVGPARARRALRAIGVEGGEEVPEPGSPLRRFVESPPDLPSGAIDDLGKLVDALRECAAQPEPSPAIQIERLRSFYEPVMWRLYEGAAARAGDLEQLELIAAGYRSRAPMLSDLTLDPPNSTSDLAGPPHLDDDFLVLSTIHSAKGMEWDVVNIIHAADGMIPSDMALGDEEGLDEELRLFYVAMTRARRQLNIFFPLRYYHRRMGLDDAHTLAQLTRFIPPDIRGLFEQRGPAPRPQHDERSVASEAVASVEVYLAALWEA